MIIREDAIYGRQSVDRKDSISIESQIEFCKYELRGGNFRKYTDKGYSGKNTDRPKFQEMMADIRRGLIKRVVVYKLDRISRSILDFATMMETFQEYNVEFVSSTEKFDTSTPMGRAMLNICIVFAQLERETIPLRRLTTLPQPARRRLMQVLFRWLTTSRQETWRTLPALLQPMTMRLAATCRHSWTAPGIGKTLCLSLTTSPT